MLALGVIRICFLPGDTFILVKRNAFEKDRNYGGPGDGDGKDKDPKPISKNKKGSINKEFPDQYRNKTLDDIEKAAKAGEEGG